VVGGELFSRIGTSRFNSIDLRASRGIFLKEKDKIGFKA